MNRKSWFIASALLVVASGPLVTSWVPLSTLPTPPSVVYPGNHSFYHATGSRGPYGWNTDYRVHQPGYLASGLKNGGELLPQGSYRYDFYLAPRAGHMASLFSHANDLVRVEVFDLTTQEIIQSRTFQLSDVPAKRAKMVRKGLIFSTLGRSGHRFEPRVYWHGLAGASLLRVERASLAHVPRSSLRQKAHVFEKMMSDTFIDRGYVVLREPSGVPGDTADTVIWTGIYIAAQAWRYQFNQDPEALRRLESSLWALHRLAQASKIPGTLVRYIDAEGRALEQQPSKDTYTGFYYAMAQGLPLVKDPALRKALMADIEKLTNHFLDHDLVFLSDKRALDLNPYPTSRTIHELLVEVQEDASLRRGIIKAANIVRWYSWLHFRKPPPSFKRLIRALDDPDPIRLETEFLPLANDLRILLEHIQRDIHRSALRGPRQGLTDTPYIKLDLLLLKTLSNLDNQTDGKPLASLEELKILPSQAMHALHFIKVAAELLPKPNRYDQYYRQNLYEGKALLRTLTHWHHMDEDALVAIKGASEANTYRTSSSHISYLALHNLIMLEKDPLLRFKYQKMFEEEYQPMRQDYNAMIDAMHAAVGLSANQIGLAWYSLGRYPIDRRGKGEDYWILNRSALTTAFGGVVNGQARDPVPPDLRPRDAFIWQRSARSIRGDHKDWLYPPLDYLFAYWLATKSASLDAVAEKS